MGRSHTSDARNNSKEPEGQHAFVCDAPPIVNGVYEPTHPSECALPYVGIGSPGRNGRVRAERTHTIAVDRFVGDDTIPVGR